jgi:tRNA modification GTPase
MSDTIFALSSGQPPAAIAIVRVSGAAAASALGSLCGATIEPRRPQLRTLRHQGEELDRALVLFFDGPRHRYGRGPCGIPPARRTRGGGGRALGPVEHAGAARRDPGEFTRRAFANGRIDLPEAEGLAICSQRKRTASAGQRCGSSGGRAEPRIDDWGMRLLGLAAAVEAQLDFADEGDVAEGLPGAWHEERATLAEEVEGSWRARLRSGCATGCGW